MNLAVALNQLKKKVAIMDADIYGPSLPILMNLRDQKPDVNRRKMMVPMISYGIKCMSMGFLMPENSPVIWRGPMVFHFPFFFLKRLLMLEIDGFHFCDF